MPLGEAGTEQFTVETAIDGRFNSSQKIHDPFVHTTVALVLDRWSSLKNLLRPTPIKVSVCVRGTDAAQRRIMMLNPEELQAEDAEIQRTRQKSRGTADGMSFLAE